MFSRGQDSAAGKNRRPVHFLPENAYLIVNSQVFPLDEMEITIGRGLENQLVINDEGVSRVHARLVASEDHFTIYDAGSTNGTVVNGQEITSRVLVSGDTIRLADVHLLYVEMSPEEIDKSRDRTRYPISDD